MKSLGLKLILGFLFVLSMVVAVGSYASIASETSLREAIGQNSALVADRMLVGMNMAVYSWRDRLEQRALGAEYLDAAQSSNRSFAAMASPGDHMERAENEWRSTVKGMIPASMQALLKAPLSITLQRLYFANYTRLGSEETVGEVIVTNAYGAAIALTGTVSRYRYDGDPLWRQAREAGSGVGGMERDEATGRLVIPLAVSIPDEQGRSAGVFMARIFAETVLGEGLGAKGVYESTRLRIISEDGLLVYSSAPYDFLSDASGEQYARGATGDGGWFLSAEGGERVLVSYAVSRPYAGFAGMPWTLAVINDLAEVLVPSQRLRTGIVLVSSILLALGLACALIISRSITRPLALLQEAAAQVARGNLGYAIRIRGGDELARLSRSFAEMQNGLQAITYFAERVASGDLTVQSVRRSDEDALGIALEGMLDNLRRQTREILDGAMAVAGAASGISASTSQIAAGSAQTAAAVSETTTTIEEVKQTVHMSNEKARHLADKARRTEEKAQAGRVSVEETTMVMIGHIHEQMGTIGESIMRLSEQSASIGDITTTVNDLADQSNLLAVNAAIEAAKAGEQGKGFAVVAQEIRSLAEQSKRATAQVRSLLTEIQKATSGAVMATEQGSKAVDLGMKQAGESKESIKSLAETVAEAALGAAQIAASSQEQLVGMDQVAMAMESIKLATSLSVDKTRQLETEAQNLHSVGERLKQLVERYRM